jgi:hypothetical protein
MRRSPASPVAAWVRASFKSSAGDSGALLGRPTGKGIRLTEVCLREGTCRFAGLFSAERVEEILAGQLVQSGGEILDDRFSYPERCCVCELGLRAVPQRRRSVVELNVVFIPSTDTTLNRCQPSVSEIP